MFLATTSGVASISTLRFHWCILLFGPRLQRKFVSSKDPADMNYYIHDTSVVSLLFLSSLDASVRACSTGLVSRGLLTSTRRRCVFHSHFSQGVG